MKVLAWIQVQLLRKLRRTIQVGRWCVPWKGRQERMKIEHPLLLRAIGSAGATLVRHLGRTLTYHFRYQNPVVNPEVARQTGQRYIYAFFHEVMLFPAYYWNWPEMHILISEHRDGELITQVISRLGFTVVRGSTTRGGARALREMSLRIDRGHLCVTPDGPRGPRRSVHQGVAYLGSRTGLPIVGAGMAFKKPWRARSWDRFAVPRPFSAAACVVPDAVTVPIDADRATIEACRFEVQQRMQDAMVEAEAWVEQL
jgi:lysophospholipid acyltransferase (LPLAT)-like uncharacterized protein